MAQQILISTEDTALVFVDCRDAFISDLPSIERQALIRIWASLAESAVERGVPIVTTVMAGQDVEEAGYSGLHPFSPDADAIVRVAVNPWEDEPFAQAIAKRARQRLVLAGVHTEGAVTFAALSALREGYDTYVVRDASVGATATDHEPAVARMMQAGVVAVTHRQLLLEWGRNDPPSRQ